MNIVWKQKERNFIRNNSDRMTDLELARELSKMSGRVVTHQAARKQRQKMGIKKCRGRGVCKIDKGILEKEDKQNYDLYRAVKVVHPTHLGQVKGDQ